jgi:hypothetical protein
MSLGATGALIAIVAACLAAWFSLLTFWSSSNVRGFAYDVRETGDSLIAPAVLFAVGLVVILALALDPESTGLLAFASVIAAAGGLANLALVDAPLPWGALKLLVFATPSVVLLLAAAFALVDLIVGSPDLARPEVRTRDLYAAGTRGRAVSRRTPIG